MVQFLRIKERINATATALADKGELIGEGNPDVEPTDVEAVAAGAAMRPRKDRGGTSPRGISNQAGHRAIHKCGRASFTAKWGT